MMAVAKCQRCGSAADSWVGIGGARYCVQCGSNLDRPDAPGVDWAREREPDGPGSEPPESDLFGSDSGGDELFGSD